MSTSQNDGEKPLVDDGGDKVVSPTTSTAAMLLLTIGDTTWRMFIPTIGLTVLGLLADKWLHTTPWIMIVGIAAGAYLAYLLVKRQIKKVQEGK